MAASAIHNRKGPPITAQPGSISLHGKGPRARAKASKSVIPTKGTTPRNTKMPMIHQAIFLTARSKPLGGVSFIAASTAENGQVGRPRTDCVPILLCHHARDLRYVTQVMCDPRCQELLQRDAAEFRMFSRSLKLSRFQIQAA